jgi:hypothetical protein
MQRVAPQGGVLLSEDLSVSGNDITGVLLEQAHQSQVKLPVPFDCVSIVLHSLHQLALLYVHCFHSETQFFFLKLVIHYFLETHALKAYHVYKAVIIAFIGQDVIAIHSVVVN